MSPRPSAAPGCYPGRGEGSAAHTPAAGNRDHPVGTAGTQADPGVDTLEEVGSPAVRKAGRTVPGA